MVVVTPGNSTMAPPRQSHNPSQAETPHWGYPKQRPVVSEKGRLVCYCDHLHLQHPRCSGQQPTLPTSVWVQAKPKEGSSTGSSHFADPHHLGQGISITLWSLTFQMQASSTRSPAGPWTASPSLRETDSEYRVFRLNYGSNQNTLLTYKSKI